MCVPSFSICQKPLTKCGMKDCFLNLNKMELMANYSTFLIVMANRHQRVLLNGAESGWGIVESGVPQGSVLGPLFF